MFSVSGLWGQTPRVLPLDTILKCDTLVCPVAEEIGLSTIEGIALLRWEGGTVMCSKWQVSYGLEGTLPGAGRVLNCNTTHTVLAYVRSYFTECKKWSAWSDGIGVYLGPEESIGVAEAEAADVVLEPNPARGRVGVKTTVGMTGLSVYNVQGALVERQEARGMQAEIDVTGWPKGVYYVTVSTPTGVAQRRLVVQ